MSHDYNEHLCIQCSSKKWYDRKSESVGSFLRIEIKDEFILYIMGKKDPNEENFPSISPFFFVASFSLIFLYFFRGMNL